MNNKNSVSLSASNMKFWNEYEQEYQYHGNTIVETLYDYQMMCFKIRAMCCNEKYQLTVTLELIESMLTGKDPGYLESMLFHEFRPMWKRHPGIKGMVAQFAHGHFQVNADKTDYPEIQPDGKYTYYPYSKEIKWYPSPSKDTVVDEDTYKSYKPMFMTEGPVDYIKLMQADLNAELNSELAWEAKIDSKTKGFKELSKYYDVIKEMKIAAEKSGYNKPVKFFKDEGGTGKHIVIMGNGQKFYFDDYYKAQKAITQATGNPILTPYSDAKKKELLAKIKPAKSNAMWLGMGGEDPVVQTLPGIEKIVTHPVSKAQFSIRHIIIDLNDNHGWTREAVADWLETLDVDLRFK